MIKKYFLIIFIFVKSLLSIDSLLIEKKIEILNNKKEKIDLFGVEKIKQGKDNHFYLIFSKFNMIIKVDTEFNVMWVYQKYGQGPGCLNQPVDVFEKDSLLYIANSGRMNVVALSSETGSYIDEINLSKFLLRPERVCILNNHLIIKPITVIFPGAKMRNFPLLVSFQLKTPFSIIESQKYEVMPKSFGSFIADAVINNTVDIGIYNNRLFLSYKLGNNELIIFDEKLNYKDKIILPISKIRQNLLKNKYNLKDENDIKRRVPIIYRNIQVNSTDIFLLSDAVYCFSPKNSVIDTFGTNVNIDMILKINNKWIGYNKDNGILYLFKQQNHPINEQVFCFQEIFLKIKI